MKIRLAIKGWEGKIGKGRIRGGAAAGLAS
jgi:hypothetical protein